ncbi:UbiH/UbiF family hydroxylase [Yoonia sp. 2307UL14-13]|uniref:UbiH/UbiF family hydroxylase n=1 Tax=Yoonia sp. 2307UL14-13 TaxID=3126506 RepID=UPI00309CCBBE
MQRTKTDILISGGGVAGLTAAAAFGAAGFDVVIVDPTPPVMERDADGADLRTTAFLQPAQRFLETAGLWPRLAKHATPLQVMRMMDAAANPPVIRDFNASDISDKPFGWNLPNWLLRREMVGRLDALRNVDFRPGVGFSAMLPRLETAIVTLTDGSRIQTRLVIGADGRSSPVRQAAGIGVRTRRYGQKAVTCALTHDAPHQNISTEIHNSGGPFTLVPLPDYNGEPCSALVWMEHGAEAQRLAALPDEDFEAAANERAAYHYGPLKLASKRTIWPIISQTAKALTAQRTALVAEAAHVMPPIGAQGLNMSLKDLATLLELAQNDPAGLGNEKMLSAYERARRADIALRVTGIDVLNRTSIAGHPFMQELRSRGITALHDIAPIRRAVMQLGLGAKG